MGGITGGEQLTLRWVNWANRRRFTLGTIAPAELRYQQVFDSAVARSGIPVPPLYPMGSAANAGLLYLLFRLLSDFPEFDVLELGAGQSSLLLGALARAGRVRSLLTLEHDPLWRDTVQRSVTHEVRLAPLRDENVFGVPAQTYDFADNQRWDCFIVDGPPGSRRHSRWGTLKLLQQHLAGEFVVIFDDAERPGERDTIERFLTLHPEAGHLFIHAAKSQCVVYTPAFSRVGTY